MRDLTTYFAILGPENTVKVIGNRPRQTLQPIEPLSVEEFARRSAANWVTWKQGRGNVLSVTVDAASVSLMENRFQLR